MFMPEIVTVPVNGRLWDISTIAAATTVPAGALSGTIGFAGAPRTEPYQRARPPTKSVARLITASRRWKLYRVFNVKAYCYACADAEHICDMGRAKAKNTARKKR
jgi:hypothetical protein